MISTCAKKAFWDDQRVSLLTDTSLRPIRGSVGRVSSRKANDVIRHQSHDWLSGLQVKRTIFSCDAESWMWISDNTRLDEAAQSEPHSTCWKYIKMHWFKYIPKLFIMSYCTLTIPLRFRGKYLNEPKNTTKQTSQSATSLIILYNEYRFINICIIDYLAFLLTSGFFTSGATNKLCKF